MLKYWLALFGAVVLSSASQMLLKKAAGISYKNVIREYLNPWVISGYFLLAGTLHSLAHLVILIGQDARQGFHQGHLGAEAVVHV